MGIRSLVSLGLLAVPVAVTVGVLVGLEAWRSSQGMQPLFVDNSALTTTYCQKAFGITPESEGQQYTLNPNQWGWNEGDAGNLCMNVTAFNNATYATNNTAPQFTVTWQYPLGPATAPVHAFPNIKLDSDSVFPTKLTSVSKIGLDVSWSYGVGLDAVTTTDTAALTTASMAANVAVDMFLDSDQTKAQSTTDAKYEVMVWLARFGASTDPIGLAKGPVSNQVINGTTFYLYSGQNSLDQYVLTWLAADTQTDFVGDISPLVTQLSSIAALASGDGPSSSDYLGYLGFGSEALSSDANVTFSVPRLSMDVQTN